MRSFFIGLFIFWYAFSLPISVIAEDLMTPEVVEEVVESAPVEVASPEIMAEEVVTETVEPASTDSASSSVELKEEPTITNLGSTVLENATSTETADIGTTTPETILETETVIESLSVDLDQSNQKVALDLPENISEEILINSVLALRDAPLKFSFENIVSTATPKTKNGFVVYEEVFQNTDVEYKLTENGLKENIVLKEAGHPDRFVYDINLVEYDFELVNDVLKIYKKGKVGQELFLLYEIRAPYMTDNSGNVSTKIKLEVLDNKLIITPDQGWIETASYPIVVDPIFEISVLNIHSHPIEGENWDVEFTTLGVGDLYIRPADQVTIDEDEFTELACGLEDRTSNVQILEGDVIFYPNWNCDEVATVSHLTLVTGHHHLIFEFGNEEESATAEAFNSAISWDGGAGTSNWEDDANWSGDVEPGASDDVTIATAVTVNINAATTIQSLTLGVVGGGTASVLNFAYAGTTSPLTINEDLMVYSGASITHSAGTASVVGSIGLNVLSDATIAGSITADGKGHSGTNGPGKPSTNSGGSYGGRGSARGDITADVGIGPTYGSIFLPKDLGSGGNSSTGAGGGAIKMNVFATTSVFGTITANGATPSGLNDIAGAGSGGSVFLTTGILIGGGTIRANGGNGSFHGGTGTVGGNGGGGRIALYYTSDVSTSTIQARGDYTNFNNSSANRSVSGAGTIYKKSTSQSYGEVIVDNENIQGATSNVTLFGTTTPLDLTGTTTLDALTIRDTGSAYFVGATSITVTTLTLSTDGMYVAEAGTTLTNTTFNWSGILMDAGGSFPNAFIENSALTIPSGATLMYGVANGSRTFSSASITGTLTHRPNYLATTATATSSLFKLNYTITGNLTVNSGGTINADGKGYGDNDGWGAGTSVGNHNYGASYGGSGSGSSSGSTPGPIYGSTTTPIDLGSGGGPNCSRGGFGGGAIILTVIGTTTVNGNISANGENGASPGGFCGTSGGGSGGSVYITTGALTGSATINANGGNGAGWFGTAGGGGGGRIATILTATSTASVVRTVNGGTGNTTAENGSLYPPNAPTFTTDTVTSIRDITATGNATVTARGYYYQSQHGFVWATTSTPTITNYDGIVQLGATSTGIGAFTGSLTSLTASTTYYIRAYYATTTATYGNTVTFDSASSTAFIQSQYRFYENLDALQPTTALSTLNSTSTVYSTSSPIRLRLNTTVNLLSLLASTQSFILQVATSSFDWVDVASPEGAPSGWWNTSFRNRRKVTFNNSASAENLTDFPVSVSLTSSSIDYSKTQNSGQDIRFVDADGVTPLNYEIENWNESATSTVWVKVPQIDAGSTTDYVWIYYGNTAASDGQNATGVWDSNYKGVWHLNDNTASTNVLDSTINVNTGTSVANTSTKTTTNGKISRALTFNGSNDKVNAGDGASLNFSTYVTAGTWIYISGNGTNYPRFLGKGSINSTGFFLYKQDGSDDRITFQIQGTNANATAALSRNTWHHVVGVYNGIDMRVYVNGTLAITPTAKTGSFNVSSRNLEIGAESGGSSWFNGNMDEVRISTIARSADWIEAEYINGYGSFNTFATEETVGSPYVGFYNNTSVASGTPISSALLTGSNVLGAYMESNPTAVNPFQALIGELVEWDFALDISDLELGEDYYFRMVKGDGTAFTTYTNLAALSVSADNLAPTAGNLSVSNFTTSLVTVSISGASDAESGLSATPYIFYASNGASSGPTAQTSWIFSGLNSGTSYSFYATVTDNEDNVGTTATISQTTTANSPNSGYNNNGNGGGGGATHFVKINNGAATTTNRLVNLTFAAPAQTERILISATSSFSSNINIAYSTSSLWYLCNLGSPCPYGNYKVFARFLDKKNKILNDVWSSIYYSDIPTPTLPPTNPPNIPPVSTLPPQANPPITPPGQEKKEPPVIPPTEPPIPENQSFEVSILGSLNRKKNQNWVAVLSVPINSKTSFKIESVTDLSGRYTYEIDCDSNGTAERTYSNTLRKIYFARNTCLFTKEGTYLVSLKAFNSGQLATASMIVVVGSPVITPPPLPPTPTTTPPTTLPPEAPGTTTPPIPTPTNPPPEGGVENGEEITDVVYSNVVVPVVDYSNLAVAFLVEKTQPIQFLIKLVSVENHIIPVTLGLAGVPISIIARSALTSTFLGGFRGLLVFLSGVLNNILTWLHIRKRRRLWGTVYDSESKQPIDPAVVSLVDLSTGKTVEEAVTDLYGRYGFLDHLGRFRIDCKKTHYRFPSLKILDPVDGMYQNIYRGEDLVVHQLGGVIRPNIPMDAEEFDWNQEAKQQYVRFHPVVDVFLAHLLRVFTVFNILMAGSFVMNNFGYLSVITLALSLLSLVINHFIPVGRLWGQVKGLPKEMKVVIVLQPVGLPNVVVGRSRIASDGRYFLKSAPGEFVLKIKNSISGEELYSRNIVVGKRGVVNEIISVV